VAAEVESTSENLVGGAEGEQAIGIHSFEADGKLPGSGGNQARQEEAGEIVGDDNAGVCCERFEKATAGTWGRLNIRVIKDGVIRESFCVVGHAVEDKTMKAVAGPLVVAKKGFEDEEWLGECAGVFEGAIEGEIVGEPAIGDHPIENVAARSLYWGIVTVLDADGRNRGQRMLLCSNTPQAARKDS